MRGAKRLASSSVFLLLACVAASGFFAEGARADRAAIAAAFEARIEGPDQAPVEDAVVSLVPVSGAREGISRAKPPRATMDQQGLAFVPHVLAVAVGTVVDFPNSDQVRHSIYSFSAAKTFEVRLYRGFEAPPITFDAPGLVVLGCNIHDHMLGFVYVLESPHFAVSDARGAALIPDVPAGRYRLELRHPRLAEGLVVSREIELPAAAPLVIALGESPPGRPPARPEVDPLQSLFGAGSR
ncbi:MAG: methylamine utilization protein [Myxococcota bacterium]